MKKKLALLAGCLLSSLPLMAQEGAEAAPRQNNMMQTLIIIVLAFVFFYFLLWRPEQKRRKTMEKQREAMKKGDHVTAMGIVGTIVRIQDKTVILRMVDGAKIEMLKAAITDVQPGTEEDLKKVEKEEGKRVELPSSSQE